MEPMIAMREDDLTIPENITFAYYAIYNLFKKYVLKEDVDDWMIVNQALSSEEDPVFRHMINFVVTDQLGFV